MKVMEQPLAPLEHLSEADIDEQLRGYPPATIAAAKRIRHPGTPDDIESFLLALLEFFLPSADTGDNTSPPPPTADSTLSLRDDLGLDSLALSEAVFKIEELFDIRVENSELPELKTLGDARRLLTDKISTRPA